MPTYSLLRSCAVTAVSMGPAVTESSSSPCHLKSVAMLERSPPRDSNHCKPSVLCAPPTEYSEETTARLTQSSLLSVDQPLLVSAPVLLSSGSQLVTGSAVDTQTDCSVTAGTVTVTRLRPTNGANTTTTSSVSPLVRPSNGKPLLLLSSTGKEPRQSVLRTPLANRVQVSQPQDVIMLNRPSGATVLGQAANTVMGQTANVVMAQTSKTVTSSHSIISQMLTSSTSGDVTSLLRGGVHRLAGQRVMVSTTGPAPQSLLTGVWRGNGSVVSSSGCCSRQQHDLNSQAAVVRSAKQLRRIEALLTRLSRLQCKQGNAQTKQQLGEFVEKQRRHFATLSRTLRASHPEPQQAEETSTPTVSSPVVTQPSGSTAAVTGESPTLVSLQESVVSDNLASMQTMSTQALVRLVRSVQKQPNSPSSSTSPNLSSSLAMEPVVARDVAPATGRIRHCLRHAERQADSDLTDSSDDETSRLTSPLTPAVTGLTPAPSPSQQGPPAVTPSHRQSRDTADETTDPPAAKHRKQRAEKQWLCRRAVIGARWTWLQAQVSDLEYRIRQHTDFYRKLRLSKGRVTLKEVEPSTAPGIKLDPFVPRAADTSPDSSDSAHVTINHSNLINQVSRPTHDPSTTDLLLKGLDTAAGGVSSTAPSGVSGVLGRPEVVGPAGDASSVEDTTYQGAARCRPLCKAIPRRRFFHMHSVQSNRALDVLRCSCYSPESLGPCALCSGKLNHTHTLLQAMQPPLRTGGVHGTELSERLVLLDHGYHSRLCDPSESDASVLHEALFRRATRVSSCQPAAAPVGSGKTSVPADRASPGDVNGARRLASIHNERHSKKLKKRSLHRSQTIDSHKHLYKAHGLKKKQSKRRNSLYSLDSSRARRRCYSLQELTDSSRSARRSAETNDEKDGWIDKVRMRKRRGSAVYVDWVNSEDEKNRRSVEVKDELNSSGGWRRAAVYDEQYDINNVVIPSSLAGAVTKIRVLEYKQIQTPAWRQQASNGELLNQQASVDVNGRLVIRATDEDRENTCDESYEARHAAAENIEQRQQAAARKKRAVDVQTDKVNAQPTTFTQRSYVKRSFPLPATTITEQL